MAKNRMKDWIRIAAKAGVILTEPKVRAAIADDLKDRYEGVSDTVSSKYDEAVSRMEAVGAALQGRKRSSSSPIIGFVVGLGVGAGLGLLLAPASGTQTRATLRDKANDLTDQLFSSATTIGDRVHRSVSHMPSTGTGTEG
jgi:YtxH-like protein